MAEKRQEIKFQATVEKVQTLADGGIRLTLDLPESAVMEAAQLMECKRWGAVLDIITSAQILTELDDETKKGTEGKGARVDRRRSANRRDQR